MSTTPTQHRSPELQPSSIHTPRRTPLMSPRKPVSAARAAPYMVALSGWPEPVYIDSQGAGPVRSARSRSGTPNRSISGPSGEGSEGYPGADKGTGVKVTVSTASTGHVIWSDHTEGDVGKGSQPKIPIHGPTITEALYPYLHSNTRSTPPISTPSSPSAAQAFAKPTKLSSSGSASATPPPFTLPGPSRMARASRSNEIPISSHSATKFADPRFTPHASVLGRQGGHLRVVPSWTNSAPSPAAARVLLSKYDPTPVYSSIRTQHPPDEEVPKDDIEAENRMEMEQDGHGRRAARGVGGRVLQLGLMSGQTGQAILRSTPEVYPPPRQFGLSFSRRGSTAGQEVPVVATEVYPRDPENMVLWPGVESRRECSKLAEYEGSDGRGTPVQERIRGSGEPRREGDEMVID